MFESSTNDSFFFFQINSVVKTDFSFYDTLSVVSEKYRDHLTS